MRLNRTAQVGLIVIVFALILAGILAIRRPSDPTTANAVNTGNNVVPVAADPDAPPVSSGGAFRARVDIPERTLLTRSLFEPVPLGEEESADVFVTDFRTQGIGFLTARPILKGQKLQQGDLLGHISDLGVSAAVRDGFRALAIPVPNKPTLHDIVSIGDFVDVVATFDQAESRVVADGVRVLAVDVFGRDYETGSLAKRGGFRGDDRPGGPPPPPAENGQPGPPPGEAAPTPTPAPGTPQAARPEASITVELRPEQATAIALAQAANAPLDFLIQPRPTTLSAPQLTVARVIKPQIAPYAVASKRTGGAAPSGSGGGGGSAAQRGSGSVRQVASSGGGDGGVRRRPLPPSMWPNPDSNMGTQLPPAVVGTGGITPVPVATPRKTYDIVIYPDGLPPRTNTVPLPE